MLRRVWALRKLQAECSCEFQLKHTEALNGIWAQLDTRDWTMKSTDFCASWKCCRLPLVVWVGGVWRWRELLKPCCTPQSWGTYIIYAYIEIDEGWWQSIQFWWRSFDFILSHLPSITPSYSLHVIQSHCALLSWPKGNMEADNVAVSTCTNCTWASLQNTLPETTTAANTIQNCNSHLSVCRTSRKIGCHICHVLLIRMSVKRIVNLCQPTNISPWGFVTRHMAYLTNLDPTYIQITCIYDHTWSYMIIHDHTCSVYDPSDACGTT